MKNYTTNLVLFFGMGNKYVTRKLKIGIYLHDSNM